MTHDALRKKLISRLQLPFTNNLEACILKFVSSENRGTTLCVTCVSASVRVFTGDLTCAAFWSLSYGDGISHFLCQK